MRFRSSGFSPGLGGTIGSPSEERGRRGRRAESSTSREPREAKTQGGRRESADAQRGEAERRPVARARASSEREGPAELARERRDPEASGCRERGGHVVDEGEIDSGPPQRSGVVARAAEEVHAQTAVLAAAHEVGLGKA